MSLDENEGGLDEGVPGPDDALTLNELIDRLDKIRQQHGGETQVYMCDGEPVCRVIAYQKQYPPDIIETLGDRYEPPPLHVIVTDRY